MEIDQEFVDFMDSCPTPYQFTEVASKKLIDSGYTQLHENDDWSQNLPKKGFVIREKRALIAFNIGGYKSSIIVGTHCDSPVLRLNPNFTKVKQSYQEVSVNVYGGGIWTTWVDRPLRLAGCVYTDDGQFHTFDSKEPVAVIPSLAIHLGNTTTQTTSITPICSLSQSTSLLQYVAKKLNVEASSIVGHELSFVDANPPKIIGAKKQFLASARIDNLGSTFSALKAFLGSEPKDTINILVVFDYEEIGSNTSSGARGDFLLTVLHKILHDYDSNKFYSFIARSLIVSSDNAHAIHPNYSSKHDPMHAPEMGSGIVLKKSPGSQYATDMTSLYPFKRASEATNVNLQYLINRNDIPSGSTIGPYVSTQLGIPTVDIGQPQLAMHSIRELVTVQDVVANINVLTDIYNNYENYRFKLSE